MDTQRTETYEAELSRIDEQLEDLRMHREQVAHEWYKTKLEHEYGCILNKIYEKTFSDTNDVAFAIYTDVVAMHEGTCGRWLFVLKGICVYDRGNRIEVLPIRIEYNSKENFNEYNTELTHPTDKEKNVIKILNTINELPSQTLTVND